MANLTRIKNNQITDSTITNVKIASATLTGDLMNPQLTFNSNLILNGNLTVAGNFTAVQSTTTQITDPLITLGMGNPGTAYDLGTILTRASGGNRFMGWKENADAFVFISTPEDGTTTGNIATTSYSNVVVGNLITIGTTTHSDITLSGNTVAARGGLILDSGSGITTISNAAVLNSTLSVASTAIIGGIATVNELISNGAIQGTTLSAFANATVNALTVNASAVIGSTLQAVGGVQNTIIGDTTAAAGYFTTLQAATSLNTGGTATVNALVSNGAIQGTTLNGSGIATFASVVSNGAIQGTTVSASANATVEALTVNASATVGSTLGVAGNVTGGNLITAGFASVTGNVYTPRVINGGTGMYMDAGYPGYIQFFNGTGITASFADDGTANFVSVVSSGAIQGTTLTGSGTATVNALTVNNAATVDTTLVTGGTATVNALVSNTSINGSSLSITNNAEIFGNLTVHGNSIVINSQTLNIIDPIIQLNTGPNNSPLVSNDGFDSGVRTHYYDTADRSAFFGRSNDTGYFEYYSNVSSEVGNVVIGTYGTIKTGNLQLLELASVGTTLAVAGNATVNALTVNNSATVGTTLSAAAGIQATVIGNVTAAAGYFTTTNATGNATVNALTVNNSATVGGAFSATGNAIVGNLSTTNIVAVNGEFTNNVTVLGTLTATSNLVANTSGIFFGNVDTGLNAIYAGLPSYTLLPNVIAQFTSNVNNYAQINAQNLNDGTDASTDLVLTANDGTDSANFIDLGIGGSNYAYSGFEAYGAHDGYLLINGGNLLLNVDTADKSLKFVVGGSANADVVGDFSNLRLAVNVATTSTNSTDGALVIAGGAGIAGAINGGLTLNVVGAATVNELISNGAIQGTTVGASANATVNALTVNTSSTLGNVSISNVTVTSTLSNTGLTINPNGTGATVINSGLNNSRTVINGTSANAFVVSGTQVGVNTHSFISGSIFQINGSDSLLLPVGTQGDRPGTPAAGMFRFSTTLGAIEWYTGTDWQTASVQSTIAVANTQQGNGSATIFTLPVANASTAGTIVSINGVVQQPISSYSVSGSEVTFTEAPSSTDTIDFRVFTTTTQVTSVVDTFGTTGLFLDTPAINNKVILFKTNGAESFSIQANSQAQFTGNVVPTANITYSLGTTTNRWKDLWLSGSTIHLGNVQIKEAAGVISFYAADGTTLAPVNADVADLSGIQDTPIGNAIPSTGAFTTLSVVGNISTTGNATSNIGSVANRFNTVFAKATSAQYADLAENYLGDAYYEPGTVVEFGGEFEVTISTTEMSPRIAGVVSTNPAYLMNSGLEGIATPVALQGRVPCKVTGAVRKGDMMVSAGDGTARTATTPAMGSVIGKALENFDGDTGVIEVVVGRL